MAGTAAFVAKKALITALQEYREDPTSPFFPDADAGHTGVQVSYGYPGHDPHRELVHGGRVFGTQDRPVSGGGRARLARDEDLRITLHVLITKPGATAEEVEARACEVGEVIEDWVAANPNLGIAGMVDGRQIKIAGIVELDLDNDRDDDCAWGLATYQVLCSSRLT